MKRQETYFPCSPLYLCFAKAMCKSNKFIFIILTEFKYTLSFGEWKQVLIALAMVLVMCWAIFIISRVWKIRKAFLHHCKVAHIRFNDNKSSANPAKNQLGLVCLCVTSLPVTRAHTPSAMIFPPLLPAHVLWRSVRSKKMFVNSVPTMIYLDNLKAWRICQQIWCDEIYYFQWHERVCELITQTTEWIQIMRCLAWAARLSGLGRFRSESSDTKMMIDRSILCEK